MAAGFTIISKYFLGMPYCNVHVCEDNTYSCGWIKVELKNVLKSQGTREGYYRKSTAGNISPCWIGESNNQAIWWISHLSVWGIGDLYSLGTDIRGITGRNDEIDGDDEIEIGLPTDKKYTWYYWNGESFVPNTNDIKISCILGNRIKQL